MYVSRPVLFSAFYRSFHRLLNLFIYQYFLGDSTPGAVFILVANIHTSNKSLASSPRYDAAPSRSSLPHSYLSFLSSISHFTCMFMQNYTSNLLDTSLQPVSQIKRSNNINLPVTRIRDLNLSRSRTLAGETCTSGDGSHSPSYFERGTITTKARCPSHQVGWYDTPSYPYPYPSSHFLLIYNHRTRNDN